MPKLSVAKGSTSVLVRVFIQDSSKTDGSGLTGLTSGSAGLVCYRARDDDGNAGGTQLVLSAGTRGTWSSGGFVEKDATNLPGFYELGLDNAGLVTGSRSVDYMLKGATNMVPCPLEIELTGPNNQDAVRYGLTALPNANAAASGGLPTIGATIPNANAGAAGGIFIAGSNAATSITTALTSNIIGNVTGNLSGSVGSVTAAVTTTYDLKKNTGLNNFEFVMLDSTTGQPKTGLGAGVTCQVSLDGAAFVAMTNAAAELSNGVYKINIAAADVNANTVTFRFSAAGALDNLQTFITQS